MSRLCASGDKSDLVRDSMSSSDSRSASFNRHKTDPHEKDQVNLTNDKSNLEYSSHFTGPLVLWLLVSFRPARLKYKAK